MAGSGQSAGLPLSAQASTSSLPSATQAPLRPLAANGQTASDSAVQAAAQLKSAPSRKRGRVAVERQVSTRSDTVAAKTSTAEAETGQTISNAMPDNVAPTDGHTASEVGTAGPAGSAQPPASKAKPQRKARQTRATAVKQEENEVKTDPATVSDAGMLSDASASASAIKQEPVAKPKRKPRQSKAAIAAEAAVKQEQQPVKNEPESASYAEMKSDVSASASVAAGQSAQPDADSNPKPKRKPRQTQAAAAQSGDAAITHPEAAPASAKVDKRKRTKINKVVADVSKAAAQEAAEQDAVVAEAPISGVDEHKPRKIARTSKSAATAAAGADADVSASEAPEESDVSAPVPAKGRGVKRGPRVKKAAPPDAGTEASMSETSEGESDCSIAMQMEAWCACSYAICMQPVCKHYRCTFVHTVTVYSQPWFSTHQAPTALGRPYQPGRLFCTQCKAQSLVSSAVSHLRCTSQSQGSTQEGSQESGGS